MQLPSLTWDNLRLGDLLGPVVGSPSLADVGAYHFAVGLTLADRAATVPAGFWVNELVKVFILGYDTGPGSDGSLDTKLALRVTDTARIGERVTLSGSHVARYVRRGRRFRVMAGSAIGADGRPLIELQDTETVGFTRRDDEQDAGEVPADWTIDLPWLPPDDGTVAVGPDGFRLVKRLTDATSIQQSVLFSAFPYVWSADEFPGLELSTHSELGMAREAGYPRQLVQALLPTARLIHLADDQGVAGGREYVFRFLAAPLVRERLTYVVRAGSGRGGEPVWRLTAATADGDLVVGGYMRMQN